MITIDTLKNEHRVIEQVLACLERIVEQARGDARLPLKAARQAIEFFREFADHCHHAKEEERLFPALEAKGFSPDAGPTAVMRFEHEQGRAQIRAMEQAAEAASRGDPGALESFARHAAAYVVLLRNHIAKEDHCLFPMAEQVLSDQEDQALAAAFDNVEEEVGPSRHEAYLELADELARRFGVTATAASVGACSRACHHV
jgi:hemerythrin-like domain-containing protein